MLRTRKEESSIANEKGKQEVGLRVWQPNGELEKMERYFEDVFGRSLFPSFAGLGRWTKEEQMWAPSIEVVEEDDKFLIKAEVPGVKDEDINVSVVGNTLTIEGEKRMESEGKKDGYHYSESSYGSFSRSLAIPSTVDAEKIDANVDKGVLKISLPKMVEAKPRKIQLSAKKAEEKEKGAKK